jgi:hypothetical protein
VQAIATGMFLDGLPQTLTPLGVSGAGAADVQAGLRKTLRAVLDVQVGAGTMSAVTSLLIIMCWAPHCSSQPALMSLQGPIQRLAATVEQAVAEQALYLQRAQDSEAAGEWNSEASGEELSSSCASVFQGDFTAACS